MKKVIIIGAGPAGLTAGYELLKDKSGEYEVTILEETDQIGGISKTISYHGNRMDIGGHRFFSKDKRVMDFWKELMPLQGVDSFDDQKLGRKKKLSPNGPDPNVEDRVLLIRNRVSRIFYLRKFFDYPVSMKKETFLNLGVSRTLKAGFSYLKTLFKKKKESSLENFYINRFGKVLYQMFFEKYTEKLWGRHPSQISADWGAQRVKGLSIKAVLKDMFSKVFHKKQEKETSLIEEFWYPKYGPGQLWETLALEFEKLGGKIKKGYAAERFHIREGKIVSVECNVNGKMETLEADIFISSMPLKDLVAGFDKEVVPENVKEIAQGLPYRDFITVGLLVNKLDLENKTNIKTLGNIVPDCWIYVQEADVKLGRIQIFNNWSPYMVQDPENTVWIGLEYFCNENDPYWNMSDEAFIHFAIEELEKIGIIHKDQVLDVHREKVKKAYPAYFDTYQDIDTLVNYLNQYENLYCIGRNGQHRYNNMDHSMATAFEAVHNIKHGIKSKENIWKVNTEKEYHEEVKEEKKIPDKKEKQKENKKKDIFSISIILIYAIITLIAVFFHENWRDEAQSFLIARDLSFIDIILQMRSEGHSCLWYMILAPFAKLGFPYVTMNLISWVVMVITGILIVKKAPFPWYMKVCFLFSAPFIYFYPVISRNYCLIPLALALIAIAYPTRREKPIRYVLSITLLAHTHVLMLGLVGMLYLFFFFEEICLNFSKKTSKEKKMLLISLGIAFIGLLLLVLQLYGSTNTNTVVNDYVDSSENKLQTFQNVFIIGCAALLGSENTVVGIVTLCVTFIVSIYSLIKYPKTSFIALGAIAFQVLVYVFIYPGFSQQKIFTVILIFLFTLWIRQYEYQEKAKKNLPIFEIYFIFILLLEVILGFKIIVSEQCFAYSYAKETAQYINENIPENSTLIANNMPIVSSIIPYTTNQNFWSAQTKRTFTFVSWNQEENSIHTIGEFQERVEEKFSHQENVYFIYCYDWEEEGLEFFLEETSAKEIFATDTNSLSGDENYVIYQLYCKK